MNSPYFSSIEMILVFVPTPLDDYVWREDDTYSWLNVEGRAVRTVHSSRPGIILCIVRGFVRGALVRFGKRGRVQLDICFKCNISNVVI